MLERMRRRLAELRTKLDDMTSVCDVENRDLTPDEQTTVDGILDDIQALKDRIDKLEKADADPEPAPSTAGRGRRSTPIGQGPAIHAGDRPGYSFLRAIRQAAYEKLDGLEAEVSQEITTRNGKKPKNTLYLPFGSDPDIRALMNRGRPERRTDLTTTTGAGLIFNEERGDLIDLLRARLVLVKLGATFLAGMQGTFSIPRQSGSATPQWVAEGNSANQSNESYDQVGFTPKICIAGTGLSKRLINQSSLDAEKLVKTDLALTMARELDRVGLNGSGAPQPTGLLQRAGVQTNTVSIGPSGGATTYSNIIGLETLITTANADQGQMAYATTPGMRGKLKQTLKVSGSTFADYIWENGQNPGEGEMNGYKAMTTSNIPSTLTKGSGAALHALLFGYWPDLIVVTWEGIDTLVNPYSNQMAGGVVISMEMSADVETKHDSSFSIITDAVAV